MSGKEMTFMEHLEELKTRVVRSIIAIGIIAAFNFFFSIREFQFSDTRVVLPVPDPFNNIASAFIERIKADLLPPDVRIIVTNPSQAIIAQIYIAVFLGLLFAMPIVVRETVAFVGPGLYPSEKKLLLKLSGPASILFASGCIFSYIYITPFAIDFLYQYARVSGFVTFITIEDFISFTLLFIVAMGFAFELPIIMWLLTKAGIVTPRFWKDNFRYAAVALIIFGAVITPDGSGVTMWLVAAPMILLYLIGYLVCARYYQPPPPSPAPQSSEAKP